MLPNPEIGMKCVVYFPHAFAPHHRLNKVETLHAEITEVDSVNKIITALVFVNTPRPMQFDLESGKICDPNFHHWLSTDVE